MTQEIIREIVPALIAIGAGLFGALFVGFVNHLLAKDRDRVSGKSKRRRDFLIFMRTWQEEVNRLHWQGSTQFYKESAFTDKRSEFIGLAKDIKRDLRCRRRSRFDELVEIISSIKDYRMSTQKGREEVNLAIENIIGTIDAV